MDQRPACAEDLYTLGVRPRSRPVMRSWELLDCGRRLRKNGDPRAGFISINDGGATLMTVRSV